MFEELMNAARDEYGIDPATIPVGDVDRPFKVLGKLYPERYEAVIRKAGESEALQAELDRLEEIYPADVPPGRELGALRSMLPEEEMTTSLAELRRQGKLEQPIRLPALLSWDWIDHTFLALGYGSVEDREEE